jgi:predicted  nucleic acid-binding Zn-ribbon protein
MKQEKSLEDLERELEEFQSKKRRLVKELNNLDTEIIGLKILLEKKQNEIQYQLYQNQSKER